MSRFDYELHDQDKWRNPYGVTERDFEAKVRELADNERKLMDNIRLNTEVKPPLAKPKHEELWEIYKLAEDAHSRLALLYKRELHAAVEEDYLDIASDQVQDKPIGCSSLRELAKALMQAGETMTMLDELQSDAKKDYVPF